MRLIFLAGLLALPVGNTANAYNMDVMVSTQMEMPEDCAHGMTDSGGGQVSTPVAPAKRDNCCIDCDMPDCASPASAYGYGLFISGSAPFRLMRSDCVRLSAGALPIAVLADTPKRPPRT